MDKNRCSIVIGAIALLLIVIAFMFMSKDEAAIDSAKAPEIPSPWQPTTVPYDSKCEGECLKNIETIAEIETAHLRGVTITVRPDINDAIAQLGDCLDTIMDCVDEKDDASQTATCVAQSQCPTICKDSYARKFNLNMTAKEQLDGIESTFLVEGAICAPREAKVPE